MSAQVTTVTVSPSDSSILNVIDNQSTVISFTNSDTTILQAAPAIIALGQSLLLSDDLPLELGNTGSAGISNSVSRSDHIHPSTGMFLNGGNF